MAVLMNTVPSDDACSTSDPCYQAAVKYRLERKRLVKACRELLSIYTAAE